MSLTMLKVSILLGATNVLLEVVLKTIASSYDETEKMCMRLSRERILSHRVFTMFAVLNVITKPLVVAALFVTAVLWVVGK